MLERLQKIIARAGIASRRHAEQLILSGQVRVNGRVVSELGSKADPQRDRIEAAGKQVHIPESKVYLVLCKPSQVVSTMADPEGRQTVHHLLHGVRERVFPVGRLEYGATGLVFLTNDGELANRMLKTASRLPQTYWLKVKGRLSDEDLRGLGQSLRVRMRPLRATRAAGAGAANPWYEVTLSDARRDALRKSLLHMGHPVEKMRRVRIANLELGDLPEGRYRFLAKEEVAALERAVARCLRTAPASPALGEKSGAPSRQKKR